MARDTNINYSPGYLVLHKNGELKRRGERLWNLLQSCRLCPRDCNVNRIEGELGACNASAELQLSSWNAHFGEEAGLVGSHGSGTIFLTHCNLRCSFCINGDISLGGIGKKNSIEQLAQIMLELQKMGCHNINVVTPTHYSPHLLLALDIAAEKGLNIPFVYNTSGFEHESIIHELEGVVDIYLTDLKYADASAAARYSDGASDYPELARKAILQMNKQLGIAHPDPDGIIRRGLMIRHLVMPQNLSGTGNSLHWIAENLPLDTYINIMSQYRPSYNARKFDEIDRPLSGYEYSAAVDLARKLGLSNLDIQGL